MAVIPDDTGEVTAEPQTQGINVHATPEDFGAAIGQGLQQLGAGVNKAQEFYDSVSADNAVNNLYPQYKNILNGDPNNPDQPGYLQRKGADATGDAYKQVGKDLDAIEQEQRASLWSPRAKLEFDRESQRMRYAINQQVTAHYEQQYNTWQLKTNEDMMQNALDMASSNPDDMTAMGTALNTARQAAIQTAQLKFGHNFDATKEIEKSYQQVRLAQFGAYMVSDPSKALDLLKSDGGKVLRSLPEQQYVALYQRAQEWASNSYTAQQTDAWKKDWDTKAAAAVQAPKDQAAIVGYISQAPAQYQSAVSGTIMHESSGNAMSGADDHYVHAGLVRATVGWWKDNTGYDIPRADIGIPGKDPRLDPQKSVAALVTSLQKNHDAYVAAFPTHQPTAGDLGLMHQQGGGANGGGIKLLTAMVKTPWVKASTIVPAENLVGNRIDPNATVAQAVTQIEAPYIKAAGGSFGGGGAEAQYMSPTDYKIEHRQEALEQFRSQIKDNPVFGGRADLIDKAMFSAETSYNRSITDQSHEYQVGARQTLTMIHDNGYTSDNEVMASNSQNAALLMNTIAANPNFRLALDSMYKANASGHATTNGTQFTSLLDRVLLPANDPNRLSDPSQIARLAGAGENVPLTNTGAHVLQQIAAARGTPQGEADAAALRGFFAAQYKTINPLENKTNGTTWHQQEIAYQNFVNSTLKNIDFLKQAEPGKSLTELLKPNGDIWNSVESYRPTKAMISEALQKRNQFKVNQKTGQPEPQGITQNPALLNKAQAFWKTQQQQARVEQIFEKLPADPQARQKILVDFVADPNNAAFVPLIRAEIKKRGWAPRVQGAGP